MKTESIFALLVIAILGWFGYDYLKKQNSLSYGNSVANQISAAVGGPATAQTVNSTTGWQIPYTQPTYMPDDDFIGILPQDPGIM